MINGNFSRQNIFIECEFDIEIIIVEDSKINETNKTLKGDWGQDNCGVAQCQQCITGWQKCTWCNTNYYLHNYINTQLLLMNSLYYLFL